MNENLETAETHQRCWGRLRHSSASTTDMVPASSSFSNTHSPASPNGSSPRSLQRYLETKRRSVHWTNIHTQIKSAHSIQSLWYAASSPPLCCHHHPTGENAPKMFWFQVCALVKASGEKAKSLKVFSSNNVSMLLPEEQLSKIGNKKQTHFTIYWKDRTKMSAKRCFCLKAPRSDFSARWQDLIGCQQRQAWECSEWCVLLYTSTKCAVWKSELFMYISFIWNGLS